jgi:hypothetical protein
MVKKAKRVDHFLGSVPLQYRDGLGRRAVQFWGRLMVSATERHGSRILHNPCFCRKMGPEMSNPQVEYIYMYLDIYNYIFITINYI